MCWAYWAVEDAEGAEELVQPRGVVRSARVQAPFVGDRVEAGQEEVAMAPFCVWESENTLPTIDVPWRRLSVSLPEYLFWKNDRELVPERSGLRVQALSG